MNHQQTIETKSTDHYDVLVCGGGTAGSIAAIQAARAGAKTILIESGSQLGGTITTGGVSFPGLFHAHGRQIIRGIGWELIEAAVQLNDDHLQDFTKPYQHHPEHQIHINPYIYALLCEEKCLEAGVHIRYYETPVNAMFDGTQWIVDVSGKGTSSRLFCHQLIDCTGNALLAQIAAYDVFHSEPCQPGSIMFKLAGYDISTLNMTLIRSEYQKALEDGVISQRMFYHDIATLLRISHHSSKAALAANHIHGADSTTSITHTAANLNGRHSLLRLLRFLRTLPGLEHTTLYSMAAETSIRETYRIHGLHVITADEYVNAIRYEDGICYAFYPLDLHDENGIRPEPLESGRVPSIPLRALIPDNSHHFLVAGRCVSSDQMANSALRVAAPCMAMGQAAGATAALASRHGINPQDVPIREIHSLLRQHDAILPV